MEDNLHVLERRRGVFKLLEHLGGRVSNNEVFSRDKNPSVGQTF